MMKNIFITGINGVGKTSVTDALKKELVNIEVVHSSSEYMSFLGIDKGNYNALRSITEKQHRKALRDFINQLIERNKKKTLIIDGHLIVFDQGNSPIIKISDWIKHFDMIILLQTEPYITYNRVKKDQESNIRTRTYELGADPEIVRQIIQKRQNMTENIATRASEWFNIPIYIVHNNNLKRTIKNVVNIINS